MVSVGPWIQDPDYSTNVPIGSTQNYPVVESLGIPHFYYFEHSSAAPGWFNPDPHESVRDSVASSLNDAARVGWTPAFDGDYLPGVSSVWNQIHNQVGSMGDPSTEASAHGVTETWVAKPPLFNGYAPGSLGEFDETAIGFEWQDEPGIHLWEDSDSSDYLRPTWLTVAINPTSRLIVGSEEDVFPEGSMDITSSFEARIMAGPWGSGDEEIASRDIAPGVNGQVVLGGSPIDLTSRLLASPDGYLPIRVYSPTIVAASNSFAISVVWSYNADFFTLRLTWGLRPPIYRWVYASSPYRRSIPARGDSLAGGPTRNYPPAKAQQSGRRNVGGFW